MQKFMKILLKFDEILTKLGSRGPDGAPAPVDTVIVDQEAGNILARTIAAVPRHFHLTHGGINERKTCVAVDPSFE